MPSKGQMTGMRGVYLVAAELSRLGLIASTTSRSAKGADILVTDQHCRKTLSIQVKTNASIFSYWLVGVNASTESSTSHYYVFTNLKIQKDSEEIEYFAVPSEVVARIVHEFTSSSGSSTWFSVNRSELEQFRGFEAISAYFSD